MNKRGFTLIEVLGAITILGILFAIATPAVYRYFTKSQKDAYETLVKSCYEAAHSKMVATGKQLDPNNPADSYVNYTVKELYDEGYLDRPTDPKNSAEVCFNRGGTTSKVKVTATGSTDGILEYKYEVTLLCPTTYYDTAKENITTTWTTSD